MFFSVKLPMNIGGKVYKPCICYALPKSLEVTVTKLSKEGKAETYDERKFFCNGKVLEKKKKSRKSSAKKEEAKEEIIVPPAEGSEIFDPSVSEEIVEGGF